VPALWFKVMDRKLLALPHVGGDLNKVNVYPPAADSIHARYGTRKETQ
jgi:alkane 1-monooxygenase